MKRRVEAVMSKFTDMIGLQTNKARHRARHAGEQAGTAERAVVNIYVKADRREWLHTRASLTPTHPRERTHEAGKHIVASFTRQRKNGADNERTAIRKTDTDHRCSN